MPVIFRTRREPHGDAVVLAVEGDVDLQSAPALSAALADLQREHSGDVVIDLTAVTFLDSSGLGAIVTAHHAIAAAGHRVLLVCTDARILKIIRLTRLDEVVPVFESVDAACR